MASSNSIDNTFKTNILLTVVGFLLSYLLYSNDTKFERITIKLDSIQSEIKCDLNEVRIQELQNYLTVE